MFRIDACKQRGVEPSHALCLSVLLLRLFQGVQLSGADANRWLDDMSMSLVTRLRLTRRDRERLRFAAAVAPFHGRGS